jgi:hypothetical protein
MSPDILLFCSNLKGQLGKMFSNRGLVVVLKLKHWQLISFLPAQMEVKQDVQAAERI